MMGVDSVLLVAAVGKAEVEDALEMVIVYNVRMKLSMVKFIADGFYLRCFIEELGCDEPPAWSAFDYSN